MTSRNLIRNLLVPGLLSMLSVACVYDPVYYGPYPPSVRPHYYESWGYFFYPDVQVYFHYSTGFYFYFDHGVWIRSRILPPRYRLNPRGRVYLHIESPRPYLYYPQHRDQYRPRSNYRSTPEFDRQERHYLQERHSQYEGQQHKAAPQLHTRPTPAPDRQHEETHKPQPPIRFDSPQQHQPIPLVPKQQPAPNKKSSGKKSYYEQDEEQQQGADKKRAHKEWRDDERGKRYR